MSDSLRLGPTATVTFEQAAISTGPDEVPTATGTYPLRWSGTDPGVVTVPVGPEQAVWLSLRAEEPTAVQLLVDGRNALSGATGSSGLGRSPQDYVVVPDQRWIDGTQISADAADQLRGPADAGGSTDLRIVARRLCGRALFAWWRDSGAERRANHFGDPPTLRGGGEAGRVRQTIVPDPRAVDDWDPDPVADVTVRLVHPGRWSA